MTGYPNPTEATSKRRKRPRSPFRCDEVGCIDQARWFVTSGPMFVCWNHKQQQEAEGEQTAQLGGGFA